MTNYNPQQATINKSKMIAKAKVLCLEKGYEFLELEYRKKLGSKSYHHYVHFVKDGEKKIQHLAYMQKGNKLKTDVGLITKQETLADVKFLVESKGYSFVDLLFLPNGKKGYNHVVKFLKDGKEFSQALHSFRNGVEVREEYLSSIKIVWPTGCGLYRFWIGEEIAYIGKSKDLASRLSGHTTKKGKKCSNMYDYLDDVTRIDYVNLSDADANIMEQYLLAVYRPRLNIKDVPETSPSYILQEPTFSVITGWRDRRQSNYF